MQEAMDDRREKEIKEFLNTIFSSGTEKIKLVHDEALTHSSSGLPNNQELAFLGDSVLRLIIREHNFNEHPDWNKRRLTVESVVAEENEYFARVASNLNIVEYIKFGKTYDNRPKDKEITTIQAEAFEALFGALYLDHGLDKATEIAKKLQII